MPRAFKRAIRQLVEPPGRAGSRLAHLQPLAGYALRGRWLAQDYTALRNAAWAVRNSRVGANLNPLALRLVLAESERLVAQGEPLADVLEAFAELLMRP